jgi:hypothetical protein
MTSYYYPASRTSARQSRDNAKRSYLLVWRILVPEDLHFLPEGSRHDRSTTATIREPDTHNVSRPYALSPKLFAVIALPLDYFSSNARPNHQSSM